VAEDASSEQDKSEAATPFKLDRARRKGMIARGVDLGFLSALLACAVVVQASGAGLVAVLTQAMRRSLGGSAQLAGDPAGLGARAGELALPVAKALALPTAIVLSLCVAVEIVQNRGLVFTAQPLKPDFSRLNPAKGLKRLFSLHMLKELAKNVLKFAVYGAAAYLFIGNQVAELGAAAANGSRLAPMLAASAGRLLLLFIVLAAAFAVLDQLLARREFARQMRMSRREVTREIREREGEPRQKRARKQILDEIIKQARGASSVKGADVLIVNPTHYAVALRYRHGETDAPVVQARGRNLWARRMRRAAEREGVAIVRVPGLARALHNHSRVGDQIPPAQFVAVADIYVGLRRAARDRSAG
jgi:flagellar biosynthetic protein FlhB